MGTVQGWQLYSPIPFNGIFAKEQSGGIVSRAFVSRASHHL